MSSVCDLDEHHTFSDNSDNFVFDSSIQIHNNVDTFNYTKTETMGSPSENSCLHSLLFNLFCTQCGTKVSTNNTLFFGYKSPRLRLTRVEADLFRDHETQNLLKKKKLILVLDLDHTLLNTSLVSDLTPDEKYLLDDQVRSNRLFHQPSTDQTSTLDPCKPLLLKKCNRLVQLRPLVHQFLEQVSTMFELYVYTLSIKSYAKQMVKLLDPDENYFDSRVIAREHSLDPNNKNLDLVFGQEKTILILDDRKDVWPTNNANVIQVRPYYYFSSNQPRDSKTKSLAEMKCDENYEFIMGSYLHLLKRIHTEFFDDKCPKVCYRDVRDVMRQVQVEILSGCKILLRHFSSVQKKELTRMAEKMGAICAGKLDSSVTHLVAFGEKAEMEEVLWAKTERRYLVDQRWLRDCYELWRRISENSYLLENFVSQC